VATSTLERKSKSESEYSFPFYDAGARQYTMLIGYYRLKDVRTRKRFRFGGDEAEAIHLAIQTQKDWKAVVEQDRKNKAEFLALHPHAEWPLVCWPDVTETNSEAPMPSQKPILVGVPHRLGLNPTIKEALPLWIAAQRSRIGLTGGKGIRAETFNGKVKTLTIALGLSTANPELNKEIFRPTPSAQSLVVSRSLLL
jgi:hypothetical protein